MQSWLKGFKISLGNWRCPTETWKSSLTKLEEFTRSQKPSQVYSYIISLCHWSKNPYILVFTFTADDVPNIFACYVGRPLLGHRLLRDIFLRVLQLSRKLPAPDMDNFMTETERRSVIVTLSQERPKHQQYHKIIHNLRLKNKVTKEYLRYNLTYFSTWCHFSDERFWTK